MRTKSIIDYVWLGLNWRYLQDLRTGARIHGEGTALANLRKLLERLESFELHVTLRAAKELIELKNELEQTGPPALITLEQSRKLNEELRALQKTLRAEAEARIVYVTTEKRLDVKKLLDDVSKLFSPQTFDLLPPIAQSDFTEAGKCIAFERSTAAAFHLLRGTESVLRLFYCSRVKRDRVKPLLWGPMTNGLRNKRFKLPAELLNNLDNIRLSFRNPTQHPDKVYDIHEAQDLFGLCVDVVNRMAKLL